MNIQVNLPQCDMPVRGLEFASERGFETRTGLLGEIFEIEPIGYFEFDLERQAPAGYMMILAPGNNIRNQKDPFAYNARNSVDSLRPRNPVPKRFEATLFHIHPDYGTLIAQ
jgi:hypothetical protein